VRLVLRRPLRRVIHTGGGSDGAATAAAAIAAAIATAAAASPPNAAVTATSRTPASVAAAAEPAGVRLLLRLRRRCRSKETLARPVRSPVSGLNSVARPLRKSVVRLLLLLNNVAWRVLRNADSSQLGHKALLPTQAGDVLRRRRHCRSNKTRRGRQGRR